MRRLIVWTGLGLLCFTGIYLAPYLFLWWLDYRNDRR